MHRVTSMALSTVKHYLSVAALIVCANSVSGQALLVTPPDGLMDESTSIVSTGLRPHAAVVIRATTTDASGATWQSYAGVYANEKGVVDLSVQEPEHGSYTGIRPSGLVDSMDVAGPGQGRTRFTNDWRKPVIIHFQLEINGQTVAVADVKRRAISEDIEVTEVAENGLHGLVFIPKGKPKGGVLVLGGSEGGIGNPDVAAVLASHGFVTLALAYFNAEGLPESLENIPIEYFEKALSFLKSKLGPDGSVGILGTSKGSEAALLIASRNPFIRAVVAYAPSAYVWSCICDNKKSSSWSAAGREVPFIPFSADPTYAPPSGFPITPAANYKFRLKQLGESRVPEIRVAEIQGRILTVSGDDDRMWPSTAMSRVIEQRRTAVQRRDDIYLRYRGAGHLVGKLILPSGSTLVGGGRIQTGGTSEGNALAQHDSWPRVIAFFDSNLSH